MKNKTYNRSFARSQWRKQFTGTNLFVYRHNEPDFTTSFRQFNGNGKYDKAKD